MRVLMCLILTVIHYGSCQSSPSKDKQLLMLNVTTFYQFYPQRYLQNEKGTCEEYEKVVKNLAERFSKDLNQTLIKAYETFAELESLIPDKKDLECQTEKKNELKAALLHEAEDFKKGAHDIVLKKNEVITALDNMEKSCKEAFDLAPKSADYCLKAFPNEQNLRKDCLDKKFLEFQTACQPLVEAGRQSLCMESFKDNVLQNIVSSAKTINLKAKLVLHKIKTHCTSSVKNKQQKDLIKSMDFDGYNPNIISQIEKAQKEFQTLDEEVEVQMQFYYDQEYTARKNFTLTPRSAEDFKETLTAINSNSYNIIKKTYKEVTSEKGEESEKLKKCYDESTKELNNIIETASEDYVKCEKDTISETDSKIQEIRQEFSNVTKSLTSIEKSAIFDCMKEDFGFNGNIFIKCYRLKTNYFYHDWAKTLHQIKEKLAKLQYLQTTFFYKSQVIHPCGVKRKGEMELSSFKVLKNYEECLNENANKVTLPLSAFTTTKIEGGISSLNPSAYTATSSTTLKYSSSPSSLTSTISPTPSTIASSSPSYFDSKPITTPATTKLCSIEIFFFGNLKKCLYTTRFTIYKCIWVRQYMTQCFYIKPFIRLLSFDECNALCYK